MAYYWNTFLIALVVALALTPLLRRLALVLGAVDRPVARSMHSQPIPFLGGPAIFIAFVAAMGYAFGFTDRAVQGILLGGVFIVLVGILDDYVELSPRIKLAGQVVAALILVLFDVRVNHVTNPAGGLLWLGLWSIPLTILWVVAVINVINLIDGLDGLAAGIVSIAGLTLLFSALQTGQSPAAVLLAAGLTGSVLGFLPYNFNPAKIFMGDAGSMFLGFTLAAISVQGSLKSPAAVALAVPLLALGVPILDTLLAIIRRRRHGVPVAAGDSDHLHHRLMRIGLTQRETVVVLYVISGWLGLSALLITGVNLWLALAILAFVGFSLYLLARKVGVADAKAEHKGLHT